MKSNYFYDMLLANAGNTIQAFNAVTLQKSRHTLDNIEYGEVVTDSLMEDIKYRQEKINTALEAWEDEIGTKEFVINSFGGFNMPSIITFNISGGTGGTEVGFWDFVIILKKNNDFVQVAGVDPDLSKATFVLSKFIGKANIEATTNTTGYFDISIGLTDKKIDDFTQVEIWACPPSGSLGTDFKLIDIVSVSDLSYPVINSSVEDADYTASTTNYSERLFTPTRAYTALSDARIATGQAVNGLDALVQANEEDFKDRLKAIQEYLFVREW